MPVSLTSRAQRARFAALSPLAGGLAAALLAASSCSPEPTAPHESKTREARPAPYSAAGTPKQEAEVSRTSGEMQREAVAQSGTSTAPVSGLVSDRRCGWLSNPTPGNWWLFDGHGEWILSTQGGPQAEGFDDMPDMSTAGWVETNGHYGYGCACMTLSYHPGTLQVERISAVRSKPLKQCRADRSLPRP